MIAVQVADRQTVDGSSAVIPLHFAKATADFAKEDRTAALIIAHHNVGPLIKIHVGDRQGINTAARSSNPSSRLKSPHAAIAIGDYPLPIGPCGGQVESIIAIEVGGYRCPCPRLFRLKDKRFGEAALGIIPPKATVSAIAGWHEQIDSPIAIEVGGYNDRGGSAGQRPTFAKTAFAILKANVAGDSPPRAFAVAIGGNDVDPTIRIEIGQCDITRRPGRFTKGSHLDEVSAAVITIKVLAIGAIIADHQVESAIAIPVSQSS
jgi:hypothetical protein